MTRMTKRNGQRARRHFTPEYKAEVVALARSSTKSVREVATELDLTETSLRQWIRQAEVDAARRPEGSLASEERVEVARLRRELKRVTMERDILKKAAVLMAKGGS